MQTSKRTMLLKAFANLFIFKALILIEISERICDSVPLLRLNTTRLHDYTMTHPPHKNCGRMRERKDWNELLEMNDELAGLDAVSICRNTWILYIIINYIY